MASALPPNFGSAPFAANGAQISPNQAQINGYAPSVFAPHRFPKNLSGAGTIARLSQKKGECLRALPPDVLIPAWRIRPPHVKNRRRLPSGGIHIATHSLGARSAYQVRDDPPGVSNPRQPFAPSSTSTKELQLQRMKPIFLSVAEGSLSSNWRSIVFS
jgi:hypothetical protein